MTPFAGIDSHSCSPLYATGFHAVEADSAIGAAQIFAERLARRRFGCMGYGRIVPLETSTEEIDCEFEAQIGKGVPPNSWTGRNVRFCVTQKRF